MAYIAKSYITFSGQLFTPGEVIDKPIEKDKLDRLLRLHAIKPIADYKPDKEEANKEASGTREAAKAQDQTERAKESEGAEEIDEDTAPPEIDVTEGILPAIETEKPRRKSGRRKTE